MNPIKTKFKWWWSWKSYKIEDYLEDMAKIGWRLVDVSFGMTIFRFIKDDEEKIRYAVDYNNKISDEYMIILKDDGWEYVTQSVGWILWLKKYIDTRPDLFTDNQSLIDRNKRLLAFISAMALLQIPVILMNIIDSDYLDHVFISGVIWLIYIPMIALLIFGIVRLILDIQRLKRGGRR